MGLEVWCRSPAANWAVRVGWVRKDCFEGPTVGRRTDSMKRVERSLVVHVSYGVVEALVRVSQAGVLFFPPNGLCLSSTQLPSHLFSFLFH